ncbi:hypothetical protein L9F63_028300, partial [Diploptera punctata]
ILQQAPRSSHDKDEQPSFNSLKKLRRSVSGVLGAALGNTRIEEVPTKGEPLDENWMLSRSVPNSLHLESTRLPSSPSSPDHAFSYLASGGHVMYLPQEVASYGRERSYSAGVAMRNLHETNSQVQIPLVTPSPDKDSATKRSKGRRFTFQSTVRQIERRRLAEKLSREAELKEQQRLGELEAMRRVEEEFQKKRAREKANIRQQLRLFSLDENMYSSLPTGQPPASTQVLSEFRQPSREYRDYRPSRYNDSGPESLPHVDTKRATVHHPQVVYDMPKSTQVYVTTRGEAEASTPRSSNSDNYRREFAHGARPGRSLASSDSEISQPNTRPVSRHQHRSRATKSEWVKSESEHNKVDCVVDKPAFNRDISSSVQLSVLDLCSKELGNEAPFSGHFKVHNYSIKFLFSACKGFKLHRYLVRADNLKIISLNG